MFEKLKKKRIQKKYNMLVAQMADEFEAFKTAVNASDNLSFYDKEELITSYWRTIDCQLRIQTLEKKYFSLAGDTDNLFVCLISLAVLLFCYVSGVY